MNKHNWNVGEMVKINAPYTPWNSLKGTITEIHKRNNGTQRYTVKTYVDGRELYLSGGSLVAAS